MSKKTGRIIMILGILICALGFGTCMALSLTYFANKESQSAIFFAVAWLILAVLALILVIPFILIGKLASTVDTQSKKIKNLTDKISKYETTGYTKNEFTKYSPLSTTNQANTIEPSNTKETPPISETQILMRTTVTNGEFTKNIPINQELKTNTNEFTPPTSIFNSIQGTNLNRDLNGETEIYGLSSNTRESMEQTFNSTSTPDSYHVRNNVITKTLAPIINATIAAGGAHTVVINDDGTVEAIGDNKYGQCNVQSWRGCVVVAAGMYHTVAVREDGTCLATGFSGKGQCNVQNWKNVYTIACGKAHTVALLQDGTCVAVGNNVYGQCNVQSWSDIVSISAGELFTVGVKVDGTVVSTGAITSDSYNLSKWANITSTASGDFHVVGLKSDGTPVAYGNNANNQCDLKGWKNLKQIAAGNYHTVGLTADGHVLAVGANGVKQCDTSEWKNVVAIAAGRNHTIALTSEGTLLATGDNSEGQCNITLLRDIRIMKA